MGISKKGNEKGQVLKCVRYKFYKEIWKSLKIMIERMKGKDWREQNFKIPWKSTKNAVIYEKWKKLQICIKSYIIVQKFK